MYPQPISLVFGVAKVRHHFIIHNKMCKNIKENTLFHPTVGANTRCCWVTPIIPSQIYSQLRAHFECIVGLLDLFRSIFEVPI